MKFNVFVQIKRISFALVLIRYVAALFEQLVFLDLNDFSTNFLESVFTRFRDTSIKMYLMTNPTENIAWYCRIAAIMFHSVALIPSIFICYSVESAAMSLIACTHYIVKDFVAYYKSKLRDIEQHSESDVPKVELYITQVKTSLSYSMFLRVFNYVVNFEKRCWTPTNHFEKFSGCPTPFLECCL